METHKPDAIWPRGEHLSFDARRDGDPLSSVHTALDQGLPDVDPLLLEQEQFCLAASRFPGLQPTGENLCIIQDEKVALNKIFANIRKNTMGNCAGTPAQHEEPRTITVRDGGLSDKFLRKIEFVIG